ncbi:MAG: ATPase V, partial [Oscillospiraceae bacterium]|nr:ATPase V [Oscillospiraceae bacterium]
MAVIPMKLATIVGPLEDFDNVVLEYIINHEFHPEQAAKISKRIKFLYPFDFENPYADLLRMISATADRLGVELDFRDYSGAERDCAALEEYIRSLDARHAGLIAERESLERLIDEGGRIIDQLSHMRNVNIELSEFFQVKYFKFRFGYLPRETYDNHLPLIEERVDVFFFPTSVEKTVVYGMYMMPRTAMERVDSLFAQMQFTRIRLSNRVHGSSEQAPDYIRQENSEAQLRAAAIDAELEGLRAAEAPGLLAAYSYIRLMNDSYNIRRFAGHTQDSYYILGWVPADKAEAFAGGITASSPESVIVIEDPQNIDDFTPPVKLKNNRFARAFEPFLEMYGLPAYNELDPTPFMALTYALLFGAMFGDVGQGAVLALGGLLLWKLKGAWLARCVGYAGICSILFGFFYGSVFGSEELLPFGFNVLEGANAVGILRYSINAGVVMIIIVMALNVVNGVRQR